MKILVYNVRDDEELFVEKFGKKYNVDLVLCREDPVAETASLAEGIPCLSVITRPLNRSLLGEFYNRGVRFISTRTIGYDHIDVAAAKDLGIRISNVSYSPDTVSNYTVMFILMALRKVKAIYRQAVAQDFSLAVVQGRELRNLTVGVAGTGRIGTRVIEHLAGFGCRILAFDKVRNDRAGRIASYVGWEELLGQSDVLTLHMNPSPENRWLINAEAFSKMKDGVILVNCARGSLVETAAFLDAIESGKVGGAAIDVHENEANLYYYDLRGKVLPNRDMAVLKSYPNVIVTPHTAFYTDQAVSDMVENSILSCIAYYEHKDNPYEITL
ncbi:MAG: D-lactate dehydrogenase VanH-A [Spirochaetaceae bacterium]|jgi:D-lactate dehydrogenase|nr:D-lactate dehydrogenase VanH-A [Spirochaetaceae bacterium]